MSRSRFRGRGADPAAQTSQHIVDLHSLGRAAPSFLQRCLPRLPLGPLRGLDAMRGFYANRAAAAHRLLSGTLADQAGREDLRCEAASLVGGGADAIAATITHVLCTLLRTPRVLAKLLAELRPLRADADALAALRDRDLAALGYLGLVVAEGLRVCGTVNGALPREVPAGGSTVAGYLLPGGTTVGAQAYTLHRDGTVFPRPLEYVDRAESRGDDVPNFPAGLSQSDGRIRRQR